MVANNIADIGFRKDMSSPNIMASIGKYCKILKTKTYRFTNELSGTGISTNDY